jgi:uncharacterized membrane protein
MMGWFGTRRVIVLDLCVVVVLVALTAAQYYFEAAIPILSTVFGVLFVLFLPGYAAVAALFPEAPPRVGDDATTTGGIDGFERVVLAVGLSIALSGLLGLALNYTPVGLAPPAVVATLSLFTIGMSFVGAWRRFRLPADRRFALPVGRWSTLVRRSVRNDGATSSVIVLIVAVCLVVAAGGLAWAAVARPSGEAITEFYLFDENETGNPIMDSYPNELVVNNTESVLVGVTNRERKATAYTIVATIERNRSGNGTTSVREIERVKTPVLSPGQEWNRTIDVKPVAQGENLRVTFYLYRGNAPDSLSTETAYRRTYFWVDATEPRGTENER